MTALQHILLISFAHAVWAGNPIVEKSRINRGLLPLDQEMQRNGGEFIDFDKLFGRFNGSDTAFVYAHLGENIALSCSFGESGTADWTYNERSVTRSVHNASNNTSILSIQNFSPSKSGQYTCLDNTAMVKTYLLRRKYRRLEVFQQTPVNVTATLGQTAKLRCSGKTTDTLLDVTNRVIWRFQNRILWAPYTHQLQVTVDDKDLEFYHSWGWNIRGIWRSTLTIQTVNAYSLGRYECWIQPDAAVDMWSIYPVYLSA